MDKTPPRCSWDLRFDSRIRAVYQAGLGAVYEREGVFALCQRIPEFKTDEELEAFIEGDLSNLDYSKLGPMHFEFAKKSAQVNMRLPETLLDAVKTRSSARGIPYTRFIREAIEQAINASEA